MTAREISLWCIRNGVSLEADERDEITDAANLDGHENEQWIPYYKASLGQLAQCVGILARIINGDNASVEAKKEAARKWAIHLLLAGIGPEVNIAKAADLKDQVREDSIALAIDLGVNNPEL